MLRNRRSPVWMRWSLVGAVSGIALGVFITMAIVKPQVFTNTIGRVTGAALNTVGSYGKLFFAPSEKKPQVRGVSTTDSQDKYVAVFLTNNQVYFGKLFNFESETPLLRDVYYLRVQDSLQDTATPEEAEKGKKKTAPTQTGEMSLIKLGNELHAPVDEIKLNRDHILFIEELKEDSRVVQAIRDYQKRQSGSQ